MVKLNNKIKQRFIIQKTIKIIKIFRIRETKIKIKFNLNIKMMNLNNIMKIVFLKVNLMKSLKTKNKINQTLILLIRKIFKFRKKIKNYNQNNTMKIS